MNNEVPLTLEELIAASEKLPDPEQCAQQHYQAHLSRQPFFPTSVEFTRTLISGRRRWFIAWEHAGILCKIGPVHMVDEPGECDEDG